MDVKWEDRKSLKIGNGTLPWTKSCLVCGEDNKRGFRVRSRVENDSIVIDYVTRSDDVGWKEMAHGGVSMILTDEVMTWAAMLFAGKACVAAETSCRMKKPIRVNSKLRVEGWVVKGTSRLVLTGARVLDAGGEVMSLADGKYVPMDSSEYKLCRGDFADSRGLCMTLDSIFGEA